MQDESGENQKKRNFKLFSSSLRILSLRISQKRTRSKSTHPSNLSTLSNTEDAAPPGVPGLDCRVDLRDSFSVSLFINESWHIVDEGMSLRLAFL